MEFILTSDQIGDLAPDGSITKHPALDIFGAPVDPLNPTRKHIGGGKFVCIPTGRDHEDNRYILPDSKPAKPAKEKD